VSFAAITLGVASQRVFIIIVVHFVIDSVRKLLDTPSYETGNVKADVRVILRFPNGNGLYSILSDFLVMAAVLRVREIWQE
jgi:hypothetical protein